MTQYQHSKGLYKMFDAWHQWYPSTWDVIQKMKFDIRTLSNY